MKTATPRQQRHRALLDARSESEKRGLCLGRFRIFGDTPADAQWIADDVRTEGYCIITYGVGEGFSHVIRTHAGSIREAGK